MLTFAAAVFFLLITPGPGVLSTAGVGSAFGRAAGTRYVLGLFIGNNLVVATVVSGLAAVVLANAQVRVVLFALSVGYLFYLAMRIAFAGSRIAFIERQRPPSVIDGILLQAVNPKAYAVNLTWFSGFVLLPQSLWLETLLKFLIINLIWIPIHLLWLMAGNSVNQLDLSPRTHFIINAGMATAMLVVVALAVFSLL